MLSIHSPDYVFTVLVSIFINKNHNHFSSDISVLQIHLFFFFFGFFFPIVNKFIQEHNMWIPVQVKKRKNNELSTKKFY